MACLTPEQIELLGSGKLEPDAAAKARVHLANCASCQRQLDERRANEAALRKLKQMPDDAAAAAPGAGPEPHPVALGSPPGAYGSAETATLEPPFDRRPPFAAPPPDSFAGYQIVRELHRGGQAVVYQGIQKATKRKVALKVMKEGPFASKGGKARFEREVEILGQLDHPNIVTVHDSGEAAGCFYFTMDYISGQPLDAWMRRATPGVPADVAAGVPVGRLRSIDEVLRLSQKICEAVNAAHLKGVIHRDLKPSNILIDDAGEPHILDFGLAKVVHGAEEASLMTLTGQFMGSLPWASPEQAEAKPGKIDIRTDVYSLGVILYQMLTGKFPYDVIGNMRDVLDRIMRAEPARPSSVRAAADGAGGRKWRRGRRINDEVDTIVLKCLSKERERRYQSVGELGRDIGHYLKGEPIEAKRDSGWYVLRKVLRRNQRRLLATSAIALLGLALAGTGLTFLRYQRRAVLAAREASRHLEARSLLQTLAAKGQSGDWSLEPRDEQALTAVYKRILKGESDALDHQAFVEAHLKVSFRDSPRLQRIRDPQMVYCYVRVFEHCADLSGLGVLVDVVPLLDGQPVSAGQRGETMLLPIFGSATYKSGHALCVPSWKYEITPGSHRFHGYARVRVVRLPEADSRSFSLSIGSTPHQVIPGAEVALTIAPIDFVGVDEYPANYPPRLQAAGPAQSFANNFVLARLAVGSYERFSDPAPRGSQAKLDLLVPAMPFTLACELTLSCDEPTWQNNVCVYGSPGECVAVFEHGSTTSGIRELQGGALLHVVAYADLDLPVRPGQVVRWKLEPSQTVALSCALSEYLDVSAKEGRCVVMADGEYDAASENATDDALNLLAQLERDFEAVRTVCGPASIAARDAMERLIRVSDVLGKSHPAVEGLRDLGEWQPAAPASQPGTAPTQQEASQHGR